MLLAHDGALLEHVSPELKNNTQVVFAATNQDPSVMKCITSETTAKIIVRRQEGSHLFQHVAPALKKNTAVTIAALRSNITNIKYMDPTLLQNTAVQNVIIENDLSLLEAQGMLNEAQQPSN